VGALRHQLGWRNLTREAAADVIGQVYNGRKKANGGDRKSDPRNEDLIGQTAVAVASELGVGRATVERAGDYAAAIDRHARGRTGEFGKSVRSVVGWSRTRAFEWMDAADIVRNCEQYRVAPPANEGQARAIAAIDEPHRIAVCEPRPCVRGGRGAFSPASSIVRPTPAWAGRKLLRRRNGSNSASAPRPHGRDTGKLRDPRMSRPPGGPHVFEPVTLLEADGRRAPA